MVKALLSLVAKMPITFVTVRAKTSIVLTSNFANLEVHNFPWEEYKQLMFTELVEQTSLHHC